MGIIRINRFRKACFVVWLVVISVLPAASAGGEESLPNGIPLRSAAEIDYPPFSFVGSGGLADGFSVELLRASLAAMQREVTFHTGAWPEVRGMLERGEVEALPLVGRTPEREELFDFTFPYMSLHGAIVVREQDRDIHTLGDLQGRQVAVMKGDNAEEFLRRQDRGISIVTTSSFEVALRELSQGLHDAVVIQRLVAIRLVQELGIVNLHVVKAPIEGFRQDFCFAVREGDRKTLALLNEGLALVMADGTYRRLHARWFAAMQLPADRPVIVGGDADYPPFEYLDDQGKATGFTVELTRAIAEEMNMAIQIRLGNWTDILGALQEGEIDIVEGMFYSPERDRIFDFSPSYLLAHFVTVTRKESGRLPETFADLADKKIVAQRGDVILDVLAEHGLQDRVHVAATQDEVLRSVSAGENDCALLPRMNGVYLIKKNGWDNLVVGSHSFLAGEYGYAVAQGNAPLLAQFTEGLRILEENGEYRRIYEKWLGLYAKKQPDFPAILRYIAMVALPLLALLALLALWSWSLRRQVATKTQELEESADQFKYIFEAANVGKSLTLPSGKVSANRAFAEMLGYTPVELEGKTWRDITPSEDVPLTEKAIAPLLDGRKDSVRFEKRYLRNNGGTVWADVSTVLRRDAQGEPLYFVTNAVDIDERKHAETQIKHLNRILRTIRNINQLTVRERNRETLIKEGCRLLVGNGGYAYAMIVLSGEQEQVHSWSYEGSAADSANLESLLQQGKLPDCCVAANAEVGVLLVDDRRAVCSNCPLAEGHMPSQSLCASLRHDGVTHGYIVAAIETGLLADVEEQDLFAEMAQDFAYALHVIEREGEQQKLQAQLLQAQKMESVGRLAGGVAHDYNNMLSVIIGFTELALNRVPVDDPLRDDLEEVLAAAGRAADITRQLLAFARKQTIAPQVLELNATVENMLKMLRRLIGENIDLSWRPDSDLWPVNIDPSQLDQILANLCVNARDAIADIGRVTIETANITLDAKYCSEHPGFRPGQYVLLAFSDNGCGMDNAVLNNLFEPFFTTKESSKGTGLGLATVYGIVKQNGGFINVYSEPGKGSTFKIYLPRYIGPADWNEVVEEAQVPHGAGETILVVEDEAAILRLAVKMLQNLGYIVLQSTSPVEALQLAGEYQEEIRLLLTDVVMPEMNGRQLSEKMQELYPGIATVYMSGYTANAIAHQGVLDTGITFVQKPFSLLDLAIKVGEALRISGK